MKRINVILLFTFISMKIFSQENLQSNVKFSTASQLLEWKTDLLRHLEHLEDTIKAPVQSQIIHSLVSRYQEMDMKVYEYFFDQLLEIKAARKSKQFLLIEVFEYHNMSWKVYFLPRYGNVCLECDMLHSSCKVISKKFKTKKFLSFIDETIQDYSTKTFINDNHLFVALFDKKSLVNYKVNLNVSLDFFNSLVNIIKECK